MTEMTAPKPAIPDPEILNKENSQIRSSLAAIHWAVTTKNVNKDLIVQIIKECELAIPELKGVREHFWSGIQEIQAGTKNN